MQCDCCCTTVDHIYTCNNNHKVCKTCQEITGVQCLYCNPLGVRNSDNLSDFSDDEHTDVYVNNRIHLYNQYLQFRRRSLRTQCKYSMYTGYIILGILYFSKTLTYLFAVINSNDTSNINWFSFKYGEILINILILILIYATIKFCGQFFS